MEQRNHTAEPVLGATPTRITGPLRSQAKREREKEGDAQAAVDALKNNWLPSGRACEHVGCQMQ